jgi:hypothetical protein
MSDERDAPGAPLDRATELVLSMPLQHTTVVRRGGDGRTRWLVVAVVAVMAVGIGALVTRSSDEVDADEALAAAQAVIQGDEPYRLAATLTGLIDEPDEDEVVESGTRTDAVIVAPDRWRALDAEFADGESFDTSERRRVGTEVFVIERGSGAARWNVIAVAPPPGDVEALAAEFEEFQDIDFESEEATLRSLVLAFYAHVLPVAFDPAQVERLVLQATEPVVEEELENGAVRLKVEVAPLAEIAAVAEEPIAPMALTLELDGAHRPRSARFELRDDGNILTLELEFSAWGAPLRVDRPDEADVERTPWVEEEALAAVDPELLVLAADLPEGYELLSVEVDEDEDEEDEACNAVEVEYATREDVEAQLEDYEESGGPSIELSISRLACHDLTFDDELAGRPATDVDGGYAVVRMGDVAVDIVSELDPDELAALVASLERVTIDELLARFPSWLPEIVASRFD